MKVYGSRCIGCGACSSVCPPNAIEVLDRGVRVFEDCSDCEICKKACPVGAVETE